MQYACLFSFESTSKTLYRLDLHLIPLMSFSFFRSLSQRKWENDLPKLSVNQSPGKALVSGGAGPPEDCTWPPSPFMRHRQVPWRGCWEAIRWMTWSKDDWGWEWIETNWMQVVYKQASWGPRINPRFIEEFWCSKGRNPILQSLRPLKLSWRCYLCEYCGNHAHNSLHHGRPRSVIMSTKNNHKSLLH